MNLEDFVGEFVNSQHGQSAMSALTSGGVAPDSAQQILNSAAAAGHQHVEDTGAGLLGAAPGKSFLAAFASGLIKGDGVLGSLGDGAEGVLVGRVTEAIAAKAGVDPATAQTLAATVTPYLASFIKSKLSG